MTQTDFEVLTMKSVGAVHWNKRHANRPKKGLNWPVFPRWPTYCWTYDMAPRGFFVRLDLLHVPCEFHFSTWLWEAGLNFWTFQGGAVEPYCHAHSKWPHRILADITLHMCVKFHNSRAIPSPWKTVSYFNGEGFVAMVTAFGFGTWAAKCSITKVLFITRVNIRGIGQIS